MDCTRNLKRARVEAPMASPVRHPMPEVTPEDVIPDPRLKKMTLDSLRFLVDMKRELAGGEMGKFHELMAALRAFKAGRMDEASLITYVNALLTGHPELIRGFSKFLEWDYIRSHGLPAGGSGI
ncbi:unnamed protein product [Urochloa decumbens]|uniref:Uncharacterized protein n=1 Tax=Urochloa decumbens TaxID=240449 RepID=A0ABC9BTR6_9POAL